MDREKIIVKTSIKGIITNVFLVIFKTIIGIVSNSIAIILDAVNNLSDVLSSVITIIGAKMAGKAPDKEHPYGHGRIEYISAMTIAIIILYAGFTALVEAIKKIINPQVPEYSAISLFIIVVATCVKIVLGSYVKKMGEKVNSNSLINSGKDALMDAVVSTSTFLVAIIYIVTNKSFEAWVGVGISLLIVKAGYEMIKSTLSQILGERINRDLAIGIKNTVLANENVYDACDLILNDYGPDTYWGSIHIEVPDNMMASEIDELTRKISKEVYEKHNVIITAIGIYSINTEDEEAIKIREHINKIVYSYPTVLQMHGFYINKKEKIINFDVIIDFSDKNRDETYTNICNEIQKEYKDYQLNIILDFDISD